MRDARSAYLPAETTSRVRELIVSRVQELTMLLYCHSKDMLVKANL